MRFILNEDIRRKNEAYYGGAFDIDPYEYFTREDLVEFSDEVIEKLQDETNDTFNLRDVYTDDSNIVVELANSDFSFEHQVSFKVDMRRIRKPDDLMKYVSTVVNEFKEEYTYQMRFNEDYDNDKNGKFVPYDKMSKKQQREEDRKARGTWGNVNPVSRYVPDKKKYDRKRTNSGKFYEDYKNGKNLTKLQSKIYGKLANLVDSAKEPYITGILDFIDISDTNINEDDYMFLTYVYNFILENGVNNFNKLFSN